MILMIIFAQTPFLDGFGIESIQKMTRTGTIKTHLPLEHVPYHPQAKYICVIRDPRDVCTSFHRFVVDLQLCGHYNSDFSTFFEDFINGETMYGDYFEHVRSIWSHKDDKNVLLISYEQMQDGLVNVIHQIADFLGIQLNETLLEQVLKYSSFDYMKDRYDNARNYFDQQQLSNDSRSFGFCPLTIVQKGVVGSHRSVMSKEQIQRLNMISQKMEYDMPGLKMFWTPVFNKEN